MPSHCGCVRGLCFLTRVQFESTLQQLRLVSELDVEQLPQHLQLIEQLRSLVASHLGEEHEDATALESALFIYYGLEKSAHHEANAWQACFAIKRAINTLISEYEAARGCRWDCAVWVWSIFFAVGVAVLSSYFSTVIYRS